MKDYLKQFATTAEYNTYINGTPDLPNVSLTLDDNAVHYNKKPDYAKEYLTFEALESGTFTLAGESVNYSLDGGDTWTLLAANTATPTLNQGDKILWKGQFDCNGKKFSSTCRFNAEGNIMSLMYGDNFSGQTTFPNNYSFNQGVFYQNSRLVSAENLVLPVTTLATNCYASMFNGCTSLTTAPELPATTLAISCYWNMFKNCTSLTTAPELPATTLANGCYENMFQGCTGLTTAPTTLPATILTSSCYKQMFDYCTNLNSITMLATDISANHCLNTWVRNVASTGTFTKAASMTSLPEGASGIPSGWTVQDAL